MDEEEKRAIDYFKNLDISFNTLLRIDLNGFGNAVNTLLNLIEKQQQRDDFTTAYLQGVYDGKKNLKYKIKELIEEKAKTDTYNFKTIAVKDIEELLGE